MDNQAEFDAAIDQFFKIIEGKTGEGTVSLQEAERFFPDDVMARCEMPED